MNIPGLELTTQEKQAFVSADGYRCPSDDGGTYWLGVEKCALDEWCNGGECTYCGDRESSVYTKLIYDKGKVDETVKIDVSGCHGNKLFQDTSVARCPVAILPIHLEFAPHRYPLFDGGIEWTVSFSIFSDGLAQVYGHNGATVTSSRLDDVLDVGDEYGAKITIGGRTSDGHNFQLTSYFYTACQ
jgi:hypothetical protein